MCKYSGGIARDSQKLNNDRVWCHCDRILFISPKKPGIIPRHQEAKR